MSKSQWDETVCIFCDFWYLILFGVTLILVILFTRSYWLPLLGIDTPIQSPASIPTQSLDSMINTPAISTPILSPTSMQDNQTDTLEFTGNGYTLVYPSDWVATSPENDPNDIAKYDLILSDAPGNENSQSATEDETGRITVIIAENFENQALDEWIVANYAWLGGEIVPKDIGGKDGKYTSTQSPDSGQHYEYFWVDEAEQIYIITTHYRLMDTNMALEISKIVESFRVK